MFDVAAHEPAKKRKTPTRVTGRGIAAFMISVALPLASAHMAPSHAYAAAQDSDQENVQDPTDDPPYDATYDPTDDPTQGALLDGELGGGQPEEPEDEHFQSEDYASGGSEDDDQQEKVDLSTQGFVIDQYPAKPLTKDVERLSGADRYDTAAAIATRVTNQGGHADTVFIASGTSYADGLAIGALAAYAGAPVLLVRQGSVPATTTQVLKALSPSLVVVAGGTGAVSDAVVASLRAVVPGVEVQRLAGKDRYATAARIAKEFPEGSPAFIATGLDYPDALAASGAAAKAGGPILLTPGFKASQIANESLSLLKPESIYVAGGSWSSSDQATLSSAGGGSSVQVLAGKDRYATAAAVAKRFWGQSVPSVVHATGKGYADAMVGVAVSKAFDAPILLSPGGCQPASSAGIAGANSKAVLLGGTGVLSRWASTAPCITPSKTAAAPSFKSGSYSFNITWVPQQTSYWCGAASAYMVLSRLGWTRSQYGQPLSQAILASRSYIETDYYGRTLWPGNYLGKGVERWTGHRLYRQHPAPTADQLRSRVIDSFLITGRPIILHQTRKPTDPTINNQVSLDFTHTLVVDGYNPETDMLTVLDPAAVVHWPKAARSFQISVTKMAPYLKGLGIYY